MSTKIIDLNNLAAIIRELRNVVGKLSPEDIEDVRPIPLKKYFFINRVPHTSP